MAVDLVGDILGEAVAANHRQSAFERWLGENPEGAKVFWDVMSAGYKSGSHKFLPLFKIWASKFPQCPSTNAQAVKRLVDAKFGS